MKQIARLACIIAGAAMLSGCQSFFLTSWMFKGGRSAGARGEALAANGAGALEDGRAFLREGNLSAAVASFSIAQLDRSTQADATNGLAVAYAKLGRLDLAERYFRAAIATAPDNPTFVANLLRLQQEVMLAKQTTGPEAVAVAAASPPPSPKLPSAELLTGPAQRVSRGEIHVQARQDLQPAPAIAVAYRDLAKGSEDGDRHAASIHRVLPYPITVVFGE